MAAITTQLDQTSQFLDSKITVNDTKTTIGKLAEVLGIQKNIISLELKEMSSGSTNLPNLKKIALYTRLADLNYSVKPEGIVCLAVTEATDGLQVDISDKVSNTPNTKYLSVAVSDAKDIGIDPKELKLLRSDITLFTRDGSIEKVYNPFNLSPDTLRIFRALVSQQNIDGHRLNDLSELIAEGSKPYIPLNILTELKIILQRQ